MSRAIYTPDEPPSFLTKWAMRLAFFCLALLLATFFLHRIFILPTGVALNAAIVAFAGAGIALVMALIAGLDIWITGRKGAARVIVGGTLALALLSIPVTVWRAAKDWPPINDITTDTQNPPDLAMAAKQRLPEANPVQYPGDEFARRQLKAYPDIRPIVVPRSVEECFEIVVQALNKLRYRDYSQSPPDAQAGKPGKVELVDTTLALGFSDDLVIRVAAEDDMTKIDVRSASRYGRSDFGKNAARVRSILNEIIRRLEATVPAERVRRPKADAAKARQKRIQRRKRYRSRRRR